MKPSIDILCLTILSFLIGCEEDKPSLLTQPLIEESESVTFNRWVYHEMNCNYLWREDLPDSTKCDYSLSESDFFKSILSKKDRFSYMTTNSHWSSSERYNNVGFEYQVYQDRNGMTALQILYIYDDKAFSLSKLKRGDFVIISHKEGNKLFLQKVEIYNGIFVSPKIKDSITISLNNVGNSKSSVQLYKIFENGKDRIGYVCYLEYREKEDIAEVFKYFYENNITDLILDLRYNPGGYVKTCKYLCNCIVTDNGYNQIFQRCSYNDVLSEQFLKETGSPFTYSLFETPPTSYEHYFGHGIYPLKLKRLFVITSKNTASASEATIICLKPFIEVITIGETTIGKGVGSYTITNPKFIRAIQPITMRYYNADGETTPDTGIIPNYYIPNGYSTSKYDLGDISEPLLNKALVLINQSYYSPKSNNRKIATLFENSLTPVGEPSYVTEELI